MGALVLEIQVHLQCNSCLVSSPFFSQHKAASLSWGKTAYVYLVLHCLLSLAGVSRLGQKGWFMSTEQLSPNRSRWTPTSRCHLRFSLRQLERMPWLTQPGTGTGHSARGRVMVTAMLFTCSGREQTFYWFACMWLWKWMVPYPCFMRIKGSSQKMPESVNIQKGKEKICGASTGFLKK